MSLEEKKHSLSRLPWTSFKSLNNMVFLKISYFILVGVPVLTIILQTSWGQFFGSLSLTLRMGYFSSLLLSLAHMIYQGYCPQMIKRFESPNDLYRDMLEIKSLQAKYLPDDTKFTFDITHCRNGYKTENYKYGLARLFCALFYWIGLIIILWVIVMRTIAVVKA
jgi:hypothetical protein